MAKSEGRYLAEHGDYKIYASLTRIIGLHVSFSPSLLGVQLTICYFPNQWHPNSLRPGAVNRQLKLVDNEILI